MILLPGTAGRAELHVDVEHALEQPGHQAIADFRYRRCCCHSGDRVAGRMNGWNWPGTAIRHARRKQTVEISEIGERRFSDTSPERQAPAVCRSRRRAAFGRLAWPSSRHCGSAREAPERGVDATVAVTTPAAPLPRAWTG